MDCLFCMEQKGWINDGNPLHGLAAQMQDEINEELVVEMVTSKSASLHAGSTLVKCFRGNEGARQNHYVFVPFSFGPDVDPELCIMKVQGIARLRRWQPNVAGEHNGEAGHVLAEEVLPSDNEDAVPSGGPAGGEVGEVGDGEVKEWRILFGQMASCEILDASYRCSKYSDGPTLHGNLDAVHSLPSVVRPLPEKAEDDAVVGDNGPGDPDGSGQDGSGQDGSGQDGSGQVGSGQDGSGKEGSDNEAGLGNSWYEYAVLLQDVQATALIGSLKGKRVYLPYRPMSKHA